MEFNCNIIVYQFAGNPSNIYEINPITGSVILVGSLGVSINSVGFNPIDNLIYGTVGTNLYTVDAGFNTTLLPRPTGYPNSAFNVGAFDPSGYYYIINSGSNRMYTIDYNQGRATFGKLVDPTNGYSEILAAPYYTTIGNIGAFSSSDWTWNTTTNTLCGLLNSDGRLRCVDPVTALASTLPTAGAVSAAYGAAASYANGEMIFPTNNTFQIRIVRTDGVTATSELFATTNVSFNINDATSCVAADFLIDYGDAPDASNSLGAYDYRTLLINDGPRHGIINELTIGNLVTSENDAYQSSMATGDDLIQGIQDDGPQIIPLQAMAYNANSYSLDINFINNTGVDANIYAWLDFNQNGIFETNESFNTTISSQVGVQTITVTFNKPLGGDELIGNTFIRVRITTDNLVNTGGVTDEDTRSFGPAGDGEVEDYILDITNEPFNCNRNGYRVSN